MPLFVDFYKKSKYGSLGYAVLDMAPFAFLKKSDRLRVIGPTCNTLAWIPKAVKLRDVLKEIGEH